MNKEVAAIVEPGVQSKHEERWNRACEWLATEGRRRDYPMTEGFMLLSLYKLLDVNPRTDAHAAAWFQNRAKFKTSSEFHVAFLKQELVESNDDTKQCKIHDLLNLYEDTKPLPVKKERVAKPTKPTKPREPRPHISQTFVRAVALEESVQPKAALNVLATPFVPVAASVLNAEAKPFEVAEPVYSTVAARMMAKMGYKEGLGIGKTNHGMREPYAGTDRIPGKAGIGAHRQVVRD
jgi:hypothetical protein